VKKITHENTRFAVGASPGFRTIEVIDLDTGDCYLFPMSSFTAAELSRGLMAADPDPDELAHAGSDHKVVKIRG